MQTYLLAEAPQWLIQLVCDDAPIQEPEDVENGMVIAEGSRNQTLFELGCGLRGSGASEADIQKELLEVNQQSCSPVLTIEEVKQISASAGKYPPGPAQRTSSVTGDSNSLRWFPFDTTAWRRNHHVMMMQEHQIGWYIWLLVACWERGGTLPNDPVLLAKLAHAQKPKRFYDQMASVLAEFELSEDQSELIHPGLLAEYRTRIQKVEKTRQAGLKRAMKHSAEPEAKAS